MPYIKKDARTPYDPHIETISKLLKDNKAQAGEINYVISRIMKNLFDANRSYTEANKLIGVLECIKLELYRRPVAQYEDEKIKENGDI